MKKLIAHIFILVTLAVNVLPVQAANLKDAFSTGDTGTLSTMASKAGYQTSDSKKLGNYIAIGIQALLSFLGVIFLVLLIYGGFLWMTARGNEQQVEKAKEIIISAIIGLIIILGAYAISYFVMSNLTEGVLTST